MKTSDRGVGLIKEHEGFRAKAYRCPAGVWTIGYGHTKDVRPGQVISREEGEIFLREDLETAERVVERECSGLSQNRFDSLVSFVFNCGEGSFKRSTLLKCIKANPDNPNIRYEFSRWVKSNGVSLPGLIRRRRAEADLYFS